MASPNPALRREVICIYKGTPRPSFSVISIPSLHIRLSANYCFLIHNRAPQPRQGLSTWLRLFQTTTAQGIQEPGWVDRRERDTARH